MSKPLDNQPQSSGSLFNLTRYFSITSACAIAIVTVVLTNAFYFSAKQKIIFAQQKLSISLTKNISNSFWPIFADYIKKFKKTDARSAEAQCLVTDMQATIKALIYGLPILKIKIYTLDGLTVFSTDPQTNWLN